MINITLPDDSIKSFKTPPTGTEVATVVSEGFARNCVAMEVDGRLSDLNNPIEKDAKLLFVTTKDEEATDILRHSAAHVMAQAIETLYEDAKLTIGPVVENGFYYDIEMAPVSEDDFPAIEAEMKKIIKAKLPFKRQEITKSEALNLYKDNPFKLELISELEDETISIYTQGNFTDLCRGPHLPHTGMIKAVKLMKVSPL